MYSEGFDPAPPPSRENSARYSNANPSKLKQNMVSNDKWWSFAISTTPSLPEFFSFELNSKCLPLPTRTVQIHSTLQVVKREREDQREN